METQTQQTGKTKKSRKAGALLFIGILFIVLVSGWYFGYFKNIGLFASFGTGVTLFILIAVAIVSQANKR